MNIAAEAIPVEVVNRPLHRHPAIGIFFLPRFERPALNEKKCEQAEYHSNNQDRLEKHIHKRPLHPIQISSAAYYKIIRKQEGLQ